MPENAFKKRLDDENVKALEKQTKQEHWLGDYRTVNGLLRQLGHQVLSATHKDDKDFQTITEKLCKEVAVIFLGKDKEFPGPKWNRPGQVDVYIARIEGIQSEDPVERLAGGMFNMLGQLLDLAATLKDKNISTEQWQWQATYIIERYTYKFMGIPLGGYSQDPHTKHYGLPCKPGERSDLTGCKPKPEDHKRRRTATPQTPGVAPSPFAARKSLLSYTTKGLEPLLPFGKIPEQKKPEPSKLSQEPIIPETTQQTQPQSQQPKTKPTQKPAKPSTQQTQKTPESPKTTVQKPKEPTKQPTPGVTATEEQTQQGPRPKAPGVNTADQQTAEPSKPGQEQGAVGSAPAQQPQQKYKVGDKFNYFGEKLTVQAVGADGVLQLFNERTKTSHAYEPAKEPHPLVQAEKSALPYEVVVEGTPGGDLIAETQRLQGTFEKLVGKKLPLEELGRLVGSPKGAKITLWQSASRPGEVNIGVKSDDYTATRILSRNKDGKLVIENMYSRMTDTGKGKGAKIFYDQVLAAAAMGVDLIKTSASGDADNVMNGYYTWPRLGFDGRLPKDILDKLPPQLKNAQLVSDLMLTAEGRTWWKDNGSKIDVQFNLKEGSLSRRILDAYMAEKKRLEQSKRDPKEYIGEPVSLGPGHTPLDVDVPNWLHASSTELIEDLVIDEVETLEEYTLEYGVELNKRLRECPDTLDCLSKKDKKHAETLKKVLDKTQPFREPIKVYRGIALSAKKKQQLLEACEESLQTGSVWKPPCFMSTSISPEVAASFATVSKLRKAAEDNLMFQIQARKGLLLLDMDEYEVLQSHETQYKVLGIADVEYFYEGNRWGVNKSRNISTIYLEEVLPGEDTGTKPTAAEKPAKQEAPKPVDMSTWTKTGGQLGSNPGGKYTDPNSGKQYYVKFPMTQDHVSNEVLASKLYELAGALGPKLQTTTGQKKPGVASDWIDNAETFYTDDEEHRKAAKENFAVHAWLANWDAVGLAFDNQIWVDDNGVKKLATIDVGGSLLFRAQGGPKAFTEDVKEWDSLRDINMNPQAEAVFGDMTDEELAESAKRVINIKDEDIRKMVEQYAPESKKDTLADILIARKNKIAELVKGE